MLANILTEERSMRQFSKGKIVIQVHEDSYTPLFAISFDGYETDGLLRLEDMKNLEELLRLALKKDET